MLVLTLTFILFVFYNENELVQIYLNVFMDIKNATVIPIDKNCALKNWSVYYTEYLLNQYICNFNNEYNCFFLAT